MNGIHVPPEGGHFFFDSEPQQGVIKIRGSQTDGRIGVIEQPLEVGAMIRPHIHDHDVWLQVLEGEVGVRVGDETVVAKAGSWVLKPRDVMHAMWNTGSSEARVMEVFTPAGFEEFMREVSDARRQGTLSDERFTDLCAQYGIRFFDDWTGDEGWVQRTREKFNLAPGRQDS